MSSSIGEMIGYAARTAFGTAVFLGLLSYVWKARAYRWRLLAAAYAAGARGAGHAARASKRFQSIVATGGGFAWSHYPAVTVEVAENGLHLRMVFPFSIYAPPLFLPFDEMKLHRTSWHLNAGSFAIAMERGGGVELIVDEGLVSWIQDHTDRM